MYRVTLDGLGFHVLAPTGEYVHSADPRRNCRHIGDIPTFASRHHAQAVADDLNADA